MAVEKLRAIRRTCVDQARVLVAEGERISQDGANRTAKSAKSPPTSSEPTARAMRV
jgi:hypothetical protein